MRSRSHDRAAAEARSIIDTGNRSTGKGRVAGRERRATPGRSRSKDRRRRGEIHGARRRKSSRNKEKYRNQESRSSHRKRILRVRRECTLKMH